MARILVVEDDSPVRALIRAILRIGGHQVIEAASGEEAMRCLEDEHVDLILLDLMLPGMSGHEVLERIQALPGGSSQKVIVVSALDEGDGRAVREALLGALDHLTKPFGSREIEAAVAAAMADGAEQRREQRRRTAAIYDAAFSTSPV